MVAPNVEVNRRAEGTSELNRRLGDGAKGAGALERCGAAGDYGWSLAGKQARCACSVSRRPSNRLATGAECPNRTKMAKQQGSARRSARAWNVEAKPRPNVEVNRRAEGTSELNRRLGAVGKGAAALERCGAAGDYGRGFAGRQARCAGWWTDRGAAGQQPALSARTAPDGQAAGQQPSSAAGDRGGGTAEAKPRPNVEVNRRAEGTSELNRRLGDGVKGAVALERCGVAGDYGWGHAGTQALCACSVSRRSSSGPAIGQRRRSAKAWSLEAE